jgi:hypothetical protein
MSMEKPKRRGRKPNNNIVYHADPVFAQGDPPKNMIANLKVKPSVTDKDIHGYDGLIENEGVSHVTTSRCWNCCGDSSSTISIPYQRDSNVYMVMGYFCSYECGARYLYDTLENHQLWERYCLLNEYVDHIRGSTQSRVKMAPSKYRLKEFGGDMDREDYHQGVTHYDTGRVPIILPTELTFETKDITLQGGKKTLKLYRNKPLVKNNILNTMTSGTMTSGTMTSGTMTSGTMTSGTMTSGTDKI